MERYVLPLAVELALAVTTAAISFKYTTWEWSVSYTLLAVAIGLIAQIFLKLEALPNRITSHDIFKAISIIHDLLSIRENNDSLFVKISDEKVTQLRILLRRLKNKECLVEGAEVHNIYSGLILKLKKGDEYLATTYVDDKFWDEDGGKHFFACNEKALRKGAIITRVFLYTTGTEDFDKYPIVKNHIELKQQLPENLRPNLRLRKLNMSRAESLKHVAEDKGILRINRRTYLMKLTVDANAIWKRATICIDEDVIKDEKRQFQRLLEDHEHLQELECEAPISRQPAV